MKPTKGEVINEVFKTAKIGQGYHEISRYSIEQLCLACMSRYIESDQPTESPKGSEGECVIKVSEDNELLFIKPLATGSLYFVIDPIPQEVDLIFIGFKPGEYWSKHSATGADIHDLIKEFNSTSPTPESPKDETKMIDTVFNPKAWNKNKSEWEKAYKKAFPPLQEMDLCQNYEDCKQVHESYAQLKSKDEGEGNPSDMYDNPLRDCLKGKSELGYEVARLTEEVLKLKQQLIEKGKGWSDEDMFESAKSAYLTRSKNEPLDFITWLSIYKKQSK